MAHFDACPESLDAVLDFVIERCADLGASRSAGLRAALVAEELFLNAVLHGRAARPIRIDLSLPGEDLFLDFEDTGIPFDPFSQLPSALHELPVEERPVGGLGVVLIDGFARRRDYAREDGCNRVRIWLARDPE